MRITRAIDKWWVISGDCILGYLTPSGHWYYSSTIRPKTFKNLRPEILSGPRVDPSDIPQNALRKIPLPIHLDNHPPLEEEFLLRLLKVPGTPQTHIS